MGMSIDEHEESEGKQVVCIYDEPLKPYFAKLIGIVRIARIGEMKKQTKKKVRGVSEL